VRDRRAQTGRLVGLHVDVTPNPRFYKLVAVDVHGNVSPAALVIPPVIVGVPGGRSARHALTRPSHANPMRTGARLTLALPAASGVTLDVFDPRDRMVRRIAAPELAAGVHTRPADLPFHLRDEACRAAGARATSPSQRFALPPRWKTGRRAG